MISVGISTVMRSDANENPCCVIIFKLQMIYWWIRRRLSTVRVRWMAMYQSMRWWPCAMTRNFGTNRATVSLNHIYCVYIPYWSYIVCLFSSRRTSSTDIDDDYLNAVEPRAEIRRSAYIPVTKNYTSPSGDRGIVNKSASVDSRNTMDITKLLYRSKRDTNTSSTVADVEAKSLTHNTNPTDFNRGDASPSDKSTSPDIDQTESGSRKYPHFHVTYWMFYPYNQGKTMCTMNLGPFGHLPIPQILGMCLGTRKDFGSHVGDWEHMTLFFKGNREPEEMYVSAHDAGAYYAYERLTGTFDFRRQETRAGILQHPNFPRTVITANNHPVLFSAEGSHGLWTAPGKHRFVRVPRLFDVNGFGTPWCTWKQVEIAYENERSGQSIGPAWLRFNGRWGNPKSKCHPLKKVGLNFCEYFDGPTGIPVKTPHFFCPKWEKWLS